MRLCHRTDEPDVASPAPAGVDFGPRSQSTCRRAASLDHDVVVRSLQSSRAVDTFAWSSFLARAGNPASFTSFVVADAEAASGTRALAGRTPAETSESRNHATKVPRKAQSSPGSNRLEHPLSSTLACALWRERVAITPTEDLPANRRPREGATTTDGPWVLSAVVTRPHAGSLRHGGPAGLSR